MSDSDDEGSGLLTRPLMFLSSYAPLLAILTIRFEDLWLRIACFTLACVGFVGFLAWLKMHREPPELQGRHTLRKVRVAGEGASSYLASYLLPFVTISNPRGADLLAYLAFFYVAYLVTTRTSIIQVNPTLFIFRYRIDAITDENGAQRHLLRKSRYKISEGDTVMTSRMTNGVLILEGVVQADGQRGTT